MANFTSNSISYLDHNDLNWELLNPFIPINSSSLVQNSILDYKTLLGFSGDQLLTQSSSLAQEKVPGINNYSTISEHVDPVLSCGSANLELSRNTRNKRKAEEFVECSSLNSSPPMSSDGNTKKNDSVKGKRTKTNDKAGEKPNEVVHVRARRGQATDSHSIAERIRRGKINERLRHLQDIVPGCNQTMGMAVMLDEIVNYVQSLQNQVEFLSMKLTAASQFHDFNAEMEPEVKPQKTNASNDNEAQDMKSIITKSGYDQAVSHFFRPTWPF